MSGNGGDDFICGHCGSVMLEGFDPSTVRGNPVYQCPFVKTTMTYHSLRVMVATGPHGDYNSKSASRLPGWNSATTAAWAAHLDAKRNPAAGNAGASQFGDACPGDIANTATVGIIS
jgi:hypothetical protein